MFKTSAKADGKIAGDFNINRHKIKITGGIQIMSEKVEMWIFMIKIRKEPDAR